MSQFFRLFVLLLGTTALTACASTTATTDEVNDPLEPVNRAIFSFNQVADEYAIEPAARAYVYVLPEFVRWRVGNVLSNLSEPVNFANNIMQLRGHDAIDTVARFVMNSTVGLLGMHDVAAELGTPMRSADFGQTLYAWGVGSGPYLMLPLIGPSTPRDAVGMGIDIVMDPWSYVANNQLTNDESMAFRLVRYGTTILDRRAATLDIMDALKRDSFDFYAQIRSLYTQRRAKQLSGADGAIPSFLRWTPSRTGQ